MEVLSSSIEPSPSELILSESTASIVTPDAPLSHSRSLQHDSNLPYGLPPQQTFAQYRNDPICKLSGLNYKVEAAVETSQSSWLQALAVADTGAGPNLIRADLLLPEKLRTINKDHNIVNLASASGHSLDVLGIVTLPVRIGDQITENKSVVSRALNAAEKADKRVATSIVFCWKGVRRWAIPRAPPGRPSRLNSYRAESGSFPARPYRAADA